MQTRSHPKPLRAFDRGRILRVDPKWAWHYQTLVALRDHLVEEQRRTTTGASDAARETEDSTDKLDRDFIRALLAKELDALGEINAAIERILCGTYGVCVMTGRHIPSLRLRAAPWTATTLDFS